MESNIESIGSLIDKINLFNYDEYLLDLDSLESRREKLIFEINLIKNYRKQFEEYKKSLNNHEDSLLPINYLKEKLNNQLIPSNDILNFIDVLDMSLKNLKKGIEKFNVMEYLESTDFDVLKKEEEEVRYKIAEMKNLKEDMLKISTKMFTVGEISILHKKLAKYKKRDAVDLNEKIELLNKAQELTEILDNSEIENSMKDMLNSSIQSNFNKISSMPYYSKYSLEFDLDEMKLLLFPPNDQLKLPADNVGSKSNYMFLHLCFYLGLHQHFIETNQRFVPNFLFIDQPSIPYYKGDSVSNSGDRKKLIDAFSLLNDFISFLNTNFNREFQIILVEHAPKNYWEENNLNYFHLVDEFFDGKALIPNEVYDVEI